MADELALPPSEATMLPPVPAWVSEVLPALLDPVEEPCEQAITPVPRNRRQLVIGNNDEVCMICSLDRGVPPETGARARSQKDR